MSGLVYDDLRHDCDWPSTDHLPRYGSRHQVMARWKCSTCGSRWAYAASFLHHDRMYWELVGKPSRRWRKAEARRLADRSTPPETSTP